MKSLPCCIDGRRADLGEYPDGLYVYQDIRTEGHRPLNLPRHIFYLQDAARELFGTVPDIDERTLEASVSSLLKENDYPSAMPSHITLRHYLSGQTVIAARETSPYRRMTMRTIFPAAAVIDYDIPFSAQPSSVREAARGTAALRAAAAGAGTVLQRTSSGCIAAADDARPFAVVGREIIMPDTLPSVWSEIAVAAVRKAGFAPVTETITDELLARADELFYVDHRGLTAVSRCGGRAYMHIIAERVGENL